MCKVLLGAREIKIPSLYWVTSSTDTWLLSALSAEARTIALFYIKLWKNTANCISVWFYISYLFELAVSLNFQCIIKLWSQARCQGSIMSDQFSVITASHWLLLPRLVLGSDKGSDFLIILQEINFAFLPPGFCQKFFL